MSGGAEASKDFTYEIYVKLPGDEAELKLVNAVDVHGSNLTVAQAKTELLNGAGIPNPEKYKMVFAKLKEVIPVGDEEDLVDFNDLLTGGYEIRFESQ
ncbi:hypothetical protein Btru_062894 [Bulinus truncatus]|nr:hypothetical protein Btru_062894 [Bulinus truncatus]